MDRLAKKCVIASSILHGTLLVVLLIGPAFLGSEDPIEPKQFIDFIPFKTLENSISGGGNPNVEQSIPAPQPQPEAPKPQPAPRIPDPQPVVQREEPKPVERAKPDPKPETKTEDTGWKPNKKIEVSLKQTTRNTSTPTTRTTSSNNDRSKTIDAAINTIAKSASSPVQIQPLSGPGGGGIPYAGFNDALISAYMRAWLIPGEAADESSSVVVTITLRRDGTVISSRIQTRSGNSSLNDSVQRALDKVTFVAPFPDSVKDAQKTFWLKFDPRAKRMMG